MITPRTSRRLLADPDIEANEALSSAAEDRLHQIFETMLDDKKYIRFEPAFHDGELAKQLGIQYINYAEYMNCPDDHIQLVRDFLAEVNAEMMNAAAQVAPPMGVPQANPNPTPQSNLIQNVPGAA